ncbi:MAG: nodulation protein NfeD [Actinobacteria bacterium]|nr:MAG: nodulation protein NfeD [Actinomycetota bacterium]
MRVARGWWLALVAAAFVATGVGVIGAGGSAAAQTETTKPTVREIAITGPVDPFIARMAKRGIRDAQSSDAAILIRIDTPGGLDSSMRGIIKSIQQSRVPVICWVGPSGSRAASAGTFILVGCPVAAMAPGTNVGAAHPVGLTGDVLSDKVTNDAAAYIRSLAQQRGRNADWAETAVRNSASIPAEEALQISVIDLIARDVDTLFTALDGRAVDTAAGSVTLRVAGASVHKVNLTFGEAVLHSLFDPNLAFLFFVLGMAGLILEVLHPGISVPGVVGLLLLVTSFVILGTLPVNIGGLLLLAAAFVFFVIDLKVPGHGLPTAAGIACLVVGGLYLYDASVPSARVSRGLLFGMAFALAAVFFFVVRVAIRARRAPLWNDKRRLLGVEGAVVEDLDPVGRVSIRGESWRAVLPEGAPANVPTGTRVRVREMKGLTLEVEPVVDDRPGPSKVGEI